MGERVETLKELERRAKRIADPEYVILSSEFVHREVGELAELVADLTRTLISQEESK